MFDFEIALQGYHTGDVKYITVQGKSLAETLEEQTELANDIVDGNWFVVGIRQITAGFLITNGSEVVHNDGRRGIVTARTGDVNTVVVWFIGATGAAEVATADLVAIS